MENNNYKKVNLVLWTILFLNFLVAILKIIIGTIVESNSIVADGFHSMSDGTSNIVGIILNGKTIYKDNYFYDYVNDLKFKITYNSFFQVNNYMNGKIFDLLNGNLSGENLSASLTKGLASLGEMAL